MSRPTINDLCGWDPDVQAIRAMAAENGSVFGVNPSLQTSERRDVYLWNALRAVHPSWRRGAQQIGDCVSWGAELACTFLMALQAVKGTSRWITEAATEPIYGGGRVEGAGRRSGGWSDGSFGGAAAKWLRDYGCLLRQDYSKQTGNDEHNLLKYSGKKAKQWGNYGCGGQNDKGKLDAIAREFPLKHMVQVRTVDEAAAAIMNGYPVTIASMAGFGRMVRNSDGICRWTGSWAHQMVLGGVRWRGGRPDFRNFQSWGPKSASGPDPGIDWDAVSGCSWWINESDTARILRSGDCWAYGDVSGLPKQEIDLTLASNQWFS